MTDVDFPTPTTGDSLGVPDKASREFAVRKFSEAAASWESVLANADPTAGASDGVPERATSLGTATAVSGVLIIGWAVATGTTPTVDTTGVGSAMAISPARIARSDWI